LLNSNLDFEINFIDKPQRRHDALINYEIKNLIKYDVYMILII